MTFDIEVASNQNSKNANVEESRRQLESEIGQLDSRRSLSEILNEGNLNNVQLNPQQQQIDKTQKRQGQFKMNIIDTIMEDDKENAHSSTAQADSEKGSKSAASASASARSTTTHHKQGLHGQQKSTGGAFSELTTFSAGNNAIQE